MSIFKCKMCGGTIEFEQGATVGVCDSCGTKQTLPRLDDDKKANLYDRANHFRRNNDFDKAMGIYEQILNEDGTDAEAYWSLVLCRYGIEYVEDPSSRKRIPTVNRAQFTSIYMDEDYKSALQYADGYQKTIYEEEAKAIDDIQKGILEISSKEEPFDVFICYKETDANGRRTQDSVLANDLYHQLTQEGFKVFFSRITLEDKLGVAYEPYIFAALNSAKVMVAIGTKPEYFKAVWVKNEWSRYLALIKNGAKKMLIPAYRDMDPYDLPEEFSHLQAQDMSKLGFMQDLIRGIKKIARAGEPKPAAVKETVVVSGGAANIAPLLKRAFMFLEDGDWNSANEYCEKVLDQDPENAQAYLCKLMAELKVRRQADLKNCSQPLDDCNYFTKAVRFADKALKDELVGDNKFIRHRNETARKDAIYDRAKACMKGEKVKPYEEAIALYREIPGWKDADEQIYACQKRIEEIKAKEEADRLEAERKAEERRIAEEKAAKKRKKAFAIGTAVVCACIAFFIVLTKVIIPNIKYNAAVGLMSEGKYEEAITAFEAMDGYKDSTAQISVCQTALKDLDYNTAVSLLNDGKIIEAYDSLIALNGYKDSTIKASDIFAQYINEKLRIADVGGSVYFGAYEQDNNTSNGKEDIEWIVLEKANGKALVISKQALDCRQYNTSGVDVTWESCSLRKWMNDTFLNNAFSAEEQARIKSTTVSADKNPRYSTNPGKATTDRVFLLSIAEAEKYFSTDNARQCKPTKYAVANGACVNSDNGNCLWWLRSPGCIQSIAAGVAVGGWVDSYGFSGAYDVYCVRPALWINLES